MTCQHHPWKSSRQITGPRAGPYKTALWADAALITVSSTPKKSTRYSTSHLLECHAILNRGIGHRPVRKAPQVGTRKVARVNHLGLTQNSIARGCYRRPAYSHLSLGKSYSKLLGEMVKAFTQERYKFHLSLADPKIKLDTPIEALREDTLDYLLPRVDRVRTRLILQRREDVIRCVSHSL